ncbi:MAG: helix-turn-helix domain-containing protein [Actinomycetota bacterium]
MRIESEQGVVVSSVRVAPPTVLDLTGSSSDPRHRLVWSDRRSIDVRTGNMAFAVSPPLGLWVPAFARARISTLGDIWVTDFVAESCPNGWQRFERLNVADEIGPLIRVLARDPGSDRSTHIASALVASLIDAFAVRDVPLQYPRDERAREVAERLTADPSISWSLLEWSRLVGAGERTLRRLFELETGLGFRNWRTRLRIRHAIRLLELDTPIARTATLSGFASARGFIRSFQAETGLTPAEFAQRPETLPSASRIWPNTSPIERHHPLAELVNSALQGEDMSLKNPTGTMLLAAALIVAACGSDDESSAEDATGDTAPESTTNAVEAPDSTAPASSGSVEDDAASSATEAGGQEPVAAETTVFVDDLGREVEIPANPERVVFANGELAGMVTTLGFSPLAFHDSYSTSPEFLQSLGGATPDLDDAVFLDSAELNLEALKALEPDLLIWTPWLEAEDYQVITDEIAPIVALDARANGTDAYTPGSDRGEQYSKQRKVAELVGVADALDGQIAEYEAQIADVRDRHGELIDELEWTMLDIYGDGLAWMYGQPAFTLNEVTSDIGLEASTAMAQEVQSPDNATYLYAEISAERVPEFAADLIFVLVEDPATQSVADVDSGIDALLASTDAGEAGQVLVGDQIGWTLHNVQANVALLNQIDQFLTENDVANVGDF